MIKGFSLIEVLLAVAVLATLLAGVGGAVLGGQESERIGGDRVRATYLANEGLEAVRNIRDSDFSLLTAGTYGLSSNSGVWELSGSSDTTNQFTREIIIEEVDADRRDIASVVTWDETLQRAGEVRLTTRLTNWQAGGALSCASYCGDLGYNSGSCVVTETACTTQGGSYESGGDQYCTATDVCCCGTSGGGTPTPTPSPAPTATPTPATCDSFCTDAGYSSGQCVQNANKCRSDGGTYESDGDQYCSTSPSSDTCCCG